MCCWAAASDAFDVSPDAMKGGKRWLEVRPSSSRTRLLTVHLSHGLLGEHVLDIWVQVLHGVGVCTGRHSCAHEGWVDLAASAGHGHLMREVVWNSGLGAGLAGIMSHAWSHMMAGRDTGVLHATRVWKVLRHLHACHHLRPSTAWVWTLCLSCAFRVACAGSCKREMGVAEGGRLMDPGRLFSQKAQSPTPMAEGRGV